MRSWLGSALLLVAACGGGGDGGNDDGGGSVTCAVTATSTANVTARSVTGVGLVTCTGGTAAIEVETCVQWDASTSFEDIQCKSSTQSGVAELKVENLSSCGLTSGRKFRTRVNATVNGTSQAEKISAEIGCE